MPTVILNDVPQSVFDDLQRRATADHSSIPEVTLGLLQHALSKELWLPELIPHEEIVSAARSR
jgi:hypothetical protein